MTLLAEPITVDVLRLRREFTELPGLRLSVAQVSRLLGVSLARAEDLLEELATEGFVVSDQSFPVCYCRPGFARDMTTDDE